MIENYTKKKKYIIYFFLLLIPSIFMAQHNDLYIIVELANDTYRIVKEGNIFRFYEETYKASNAGNYITNTGIDGTAVYNIVVYFAIALWLLPIKILELLIRTQFALEIMVLWTKGLLIIAALWGGYLIERLVVQLNGSETDATESCEFFICSPLLIFASIIFGQVDILALDIIIIAFLCFQDRRFWLFSLAMGLAFCVKGFCIFIYLPLLLLAEKRIPALIEHLICFFSCQAITFILFMNTSVFRMIMQIWNEAYDYSGRLFSSSIQLGPWAIYLLPAISLIICMICFSLKAENVVLDKYAVFFAILSYANIVLFLNWHPMWVILIVPFLSVSIIFVKKKQLFYYADILFEAAFIATCCLRWRQNVDDKMINNGILRLLFHRTYNGGYLGRAYDLTGLPPFLPFTVLSAALCYLVFLVYESVFKKETGGKENVIYRYYNIARYTLTTLLLITCLILWIIKSI